MCRDTYSPHLHSSNLAAGMRTTPCRSYACREKIKAHVQRKLNELRLPDFIHSIDAMDIDMGSAVPRIYNLRALPTPDTLIWPQIMFDLEYEGAFSSHLTTFHAFSCRLGACIYGIFVLAAAADACIAYKGCSALLMSHMHGYSIARTY